MVFAKRFCTAAAAIIFTFVLAIQTFAVSIDGSVSPDEVRSTNVQIQCENENGGRAGAGGSKRAADGSHRRAQAV